MIRSISKLSVDGVKDLKKLLLNDKVAFERFCHGCITGDDTCTEADGSLDGVIESLTLMDENFSGVIDTTKLLSEIIACERVNGIYIDLVHVVMCSDLTYALTWMFAMLFFFSCFGLVIVTLRAAILPPMKASDYQAEKERRDLDVNDHDGPPYAVQTGTSFQESPIKSKIPSDDISPDREGEPSDTESSVTTEEKREGKTD